MIDYIQNLSARVPPYLWNLIILVAAVPIGLLLKFIIRLLKSSPLWDKRVNVLQVTDYKEHTIERRALMSAFDSSRAFELRCFIRENLLLLSSKTTRKTFQKTRATLSSVADLKLNTSQPTT